MIEFIIYQLYHKKAEEMGYLVSLDIDCIKWLIREMRTKLKAEANLLELEAPINICGDFHG